MAQRFKWRLSYYRALSMRRIFDILFLIRFHNLCLGMLAVYTASFMLKVDFNVDVVICMVVVSSVMALGYLMNDYLDIETDKINHPKRGLVNNSVSRFQFFYINLFFLTTLFIAGMNLNQVAKKYLLLMVLPLLISYNFFFKKIIFIGNFSVSILLGFIFLFVELALVNSTHNLLTPFYLTIGFSFLRELIKDAEDESGDLVSNMKTIPIILGEKKTNFFIIIVTCILLALLPAPYFLKSYSIKYLLLLIIFIEIPLIYSLFLLIKFPSKRTYSFLVQLLKFLCFIGLIIFMLER